MHPDKELIERLRNRAGEVLDFAFKKEGAPGLVSIPRSAKDVDALLCEAADRLEALSGGEAVATDDVVRDMTGESVCGYRVAAWRETHPEHGDKFGHRYSEHWSTPSANPAVKVERLFTESQLRAALSRPMPSREEVARLVDPEAWEEYLLEDGRVDEEVASIFQDAYEASLIKADQILSLFSSPTVEGGEEEGGSARVTDSGRGALPTPPDGLDPKSWEVEIRIEGERVLTIGHSHLSGIEDIDRYGDTVRTCAEHLMSFIGKGEPTPCFGCGGSGQERWMGFSGEEVGPCSACQPEGPFTCPSCGGNDDDRQLMCEACGGEGWLGEHYDPATDDLSGAQQSELSTQLRDEPLFPHPAPQEGE